MTQKNPSSVAFAAPTREQWLSLVDKDIKGAPFEKRLVTQLIEGLAIQPLYTADDAPPPESLGLPGQTPFARGFADVATTPWQILPEHRHPLPSHANAAILSDLAAGAHGVLVRLSPRLLSPPTSAGGCGCGGGVLVDSADDLATLFDRVEFERVHITLAPGPAFLPAATAMMSLLDRRGTKSDGVRVHFGADPLGTLAARGSLPRKAEAMLEELGALAKAVQGTYPHAAGVTVSTAPYDNAGATAVQELAAALSTAVAYLRAMEGAGLATVQAAGQLCFSMSVGADQFLEIAKLRALRVLYNRVLEVAEVPEADRSMRLHARTSRRVLTQRDPWVNVLRTTIGCFAAALGGADQVTVLPFDDVIGLPDEMARRLSRNTQIILQEEGNLGRVLDAAGGSYYVDRLTLSLAEASWKLFQDLERRGGMLAVLRDGSFAKEVDGTWQKRAKDLGRRKTPITGVSEYPSLGEKPVERAKLDTSAVEAELSRRRTDRAARPELQAAVSAISSAAGTGRVTALQSAARAGATLDALQRALGDSPETATAFALRRFAAAFESLRNESDEVLHRFGRRPRLFSANMGPIATHTARATYAQNFFEVGGFEVITNDGFVDVPSAVEAFVKSGAKKVVICSSDAWYEESVCGLARLLKEKGAARVILAGNPGQNEARYREAGVDQFIFIGCDVLGTLTELAQNEKVAS